MSGARGYVLIALVVGLLMLGLRAVWRTDPTQRNLEIFTEMVYSKAAESFSENGVLPGGITQQPLVAGVVPRGELPLRYGPGTEEARRMGRELANPLDPAEGSHLDRGRELYGIYCTLCHGPGGARVGLAALEEVEALAGWRVGGVDHLDHVAEARADAVACFLRVDG